MRSLSAHQGHGSRLGRSSSPVPTMSRCSAPPRKPKPPRQGTARLGLPRGGGSSGLHPRPPPQWLRWSSSGCTQGRPRVKSSLPSRRVMRAPVPRRGDRGWQEEQRNPGKRRTPDLPLASQRGLRAGAGLFPTFTCSPAPATGTTQHHSEGRGVAAPSPHGYHHPPRLPSAIPASQTRRPAGAGQRAAAGRSPCKQFMFPPPKNLPLPGAGWATAGSQRRVQVSARSIDTAALGPEPSGRIPGACQPHPPPPNGGSLLLILPLPHLL